MLKKQRVVLIEDEYLARDELQDILTRNHRDIEVVAEAETTKAGWGWIEQGGVDGVFLDINIQTESHRAGMDLACAINNLAHPPWIVFITAYQEFALEAFEVEPTHYLLKPLDDAKVAKALDRVRLRHPAQPANQPRSIEISHRMVGSFGKSRLAVEYVDPSAEILYLCTIPNSDLLKVHLLGCRDLLGVVGPLRDWHERLASYGFECPHRSYLVNRAFRGRLQPDPIRDDAYQLSLKGGCPDLLPVRRYFQWEAG